MQTKWTVIICLMLVIGLAGYSAGQEAETITCTGKVVDSNGQPVSGAKVSLYKLIIQMQILTFDVELEQVTTTNDDGAFSFEAATESNDMKNQTIILVEKEELALGWGNWYLSRNLDTTITLGRPEVLAGKVEDESGEPVSDAEVSISAMLMTGGDGPRYIAGKVSQQLFTCKTDAAGKFQFERIPSEAAAEFIVKKTGMATVSTFDESTAQNMQLQYKQSQKDIVIKLPAEGKIEGIVVDKETGKPVPGARLMVFQGQRQPFSGIEPVTSGQDGTFTIDALCPGKLVVQAVPGREGTADWVAGMVEVDVEAGKTSTGVKVELSKGGMVEISVTELYDNAPIGSANVNIQNTVSQELFNEVTGENGIISKRLAPGQYKIIRVYKQDYPYERREETFTIEDGKTSRITVQLKGNPKVTGTVRDESGRPLAGARIKVCPFGRGEVTSDSEGRFEVRWQTQERAQEVIPYVVARHFEWNLAAAVEIEEGTKVVDVNMTTGVICVGNVIDVNDNPIENAQVYLTFWSSGSGTSMARQQNKTDSEGRYEIRAVPHYHEYSVNAGADGYGQDYVRIITEDVVDNLFDVKEISLATANLSISGVVVDVDDKPVEKARIFCQGRGQPQKNAQTDKDGKFTIEGVCSGKILISVSKSGTMGSGFISGNTEVEGGATDIRIVASDRSSRSARREPPSLVGKSLPDLSGLNIEPALTDIEDKVILVCFWDMQQRPSRRCINQLNEQIKQLADKGVTIIGIHASEVDDNNLSEWVKSSGVLFPVGMIETNIDEVKLKWGVKGLPWLVLTDKKHTVIAEGFSLSELGGKIMSQ